MQLAYSDRERAWAVLTLLPGKSGFDDGKKWLPVRVHALDTRAAMERLLNSWVPERIRQLLHTVDRLSDVCAFLALVHDIGKLTPAFLGNILPNLPEVSERLGEAGLATGYLSRNSLVRHATAGAAILAQHSCPAGIVAVVGAHHGKPISTEDELDLCHHMEIHSRDYFGADGIDSEQGRLWAEVRRIWLDESLQRAGFESVEELPQLDLRAQMLLTGLLIVADWVASNPDFFPLIDMEDDGERLDLERRVAGAWERFDPRSPWSPPYVLPDEGWFKDAFGFEPNQEQRAITHAAQNSMEPGIYILEAQMGRGKTEAALAAAEVLAGKLNCGGVFFGLPTQATANGVFPRLKIWGERQAEDMDLTIRLAHGNAALNKEYCALFDEKANVDADGESGLVVHPWFSGRKQALLSDFVIGTIDQFLMAGLKQRHLMLRHLGLAGKVIILDECHAYDAYMNHYLDRVLNWLGAYGAPVIILSATLPAARRAEMIDAYRNVDPHAEKSVAWRGNRAYPLLTWTQGETVYQEVITQDAPSREVALGHLADEALVSWLRKMLSQGGCAGVIVNTVRRAQEVARQLERALPDKQVELFHSQFLMPDRAEKENRLVSRIGKGSTSETRNSLIVVGTQVLEQSLDIDFDCMATDLCPMDLLMQRIGRLHRHRRDDRPKPLHRPICMVMGAGETLDTGSKAVYGEWLLTRTKELLPDRLLLPDSIPTLVQSTYEAPREDELDGKQDMWERYSEHLKMKKESADAFCLCPPDETEGFPQLNTINGWLDAGVTDSDTRAEARVRDSDSSLSVLLMVRDEEGVVRFLPWQEHGCAVPGDKPPEESVARSVAAQRVQLPRSLSVGYMGDHVFDVLKREKMKYLPGWQSAPWLREELVLLLREDLTRELCGYQVTYDRKWGLCCQKETDNGNG